MLSLHTNNAALSAQNAISRNQSSLSTSMTRLSTGYRINSAMDDAAGLQIATRLKAQTSGMAMAMRNTQNGISMMQTAEGALGESSNILVRMKDLATQAADAASTAKDKSAMQSEYDALAKELSNIVGNTSFGGTKLLNKKADAAEMGTAVLGAATAASTLATAQETHDDGAEADYTTALATLDADDPATVVALETATQARNASLKNLAALTSASTAAAAYSAAATASSAGTDGTMVGSLDFQIGASTAEKMNLDMTATVTALHSALRGTSTNYNSFGASLANVGTELTDNASATIDKLQSAIDAVGEVRSTLGAASNRLEHVSTNLANVSANTQSASGRIMDVDFATESANMTSNQMLLQAGTAMLKQSNSLSSMVMSLLQ
ncbi:flagellin [Massilia aurea]|uniref:flagellin N-terminal helical domain-containing protein n=1 Tax=Massilia aurea TaxID=373040 RepID=UPI0034624668